MSGLNTVEIIDFEVWDAETGESDVVVKTSNGSKLKAFSLDSFESDDECEVVFSIFPKEISRAADSDKREVKNIDNKFQVSIIGNIAEIISDDEQGELVNIEVDGVFFNIFVAGDVLKDIKIGDGIKVLGRLDIEKPFI